MKLPGVISLRKDLPICPIPNGTFFLEVLCTFLKLTKIPCAVSGLKYTVFLASSVTPWNVLNIRLNCLISVKSFLPHEGQAISFSLIKFSISSLDHASTADSSVKLLSAAQSSINLSARNLSLHALQSIRGSAKPPRCPEATHVCGFIRIAQSTPTLYGLSCTNFCHHAFLTLFLSSTPRLP